MSTDRETDAGKIMLFGSREEMHEILFSEFQDGRVRERAGEIYLENTHSSIEVLKLVEELGKIKRRDVHIDRVIKNACAKFVELEDDRMFLRHLSLDEKVPTMMRVPAGLKYIHLESNPNALRAYANTDTALAVLKRHAEMKWSRAIPDPEDVHVCRIALRRQSVPAKMKR